MPKSAKLILYSFITLLISIVLFLFFESFFNISTCKKFHINQLTLYGYDTQEDSTIISNCDDGQIYLNSGCLEGINICIYFDARPDYDIPVQLFYTTDTEDFCENQSIHTILKKGNDLLKIPIIMNTQNIRIDIGSNQGERYDIVQVTFEHPILWKIAQIVTFSIAIGLILSLKRYIIIKNHTDFLYKTSLAIILSISTVCMTKVEYTNNLWGLANENYMKDFDISSFILGIILYSIYLHLIYLFDLYASKTMSKLNNIQYNELIPTKKIIVYLAIIIFVAWIPYYLSYYPGGIYADTFASISYALSNVRTNRHPFIYNTIIGLFLNLGNALKKDITWSIGLFTAIQMLIIECEFLYFYSWMIRHRINKVLRSIIAVFYIFFPLIPLYAISVWKDTPFCMAVLFWMMFIVDLYLDINSDNIQKKNIRGYCIGCFLIAFTRNNGIYIVFFSIIILIILIIRINKKEVGIILASVITLTTIIVIQGPIYNIFGVSQTETVENLGIPLQQIGAVVAYDGVITEEQKKIINNIIPYQNIKDHYSPTLVDNLKWNAGMNQNKRMNGYSLIAIQLFGQFINGIQ